MKTHENKIHASNKERNRLRQLGKIWMEIAMSEDVITKRRQWKALRDLRPERPMLLFETFGVINYINEDELLCINPILRNIEKNLWHHIKHYNEIKDDIVLDPYLRLCYDFGVSDYGVPIIEKTVEGSMAYMSNFPIKTPDDIVMLKPRSFYVNKESSQQLFETLSEIMGYDVPIKLGNLDAVSSMVSSSNSTLKGYYPFCGLQAVFLTATLYKLIGNENLLFWVYDHPEALHAILRFLTDDRKRYFDWLINEEILIPNTDAQHAGPFSYGYVTGLPDANSKGTAKLKDCWVWLESQETAMISPDMFEEIFLPYLAEISDLFGLTYYGCCEPVDDRIDRILKKLPNIRTVSVSAWNDFGKVAEILGNDYVYCRKPNPSLLSGKQADWESAKQDIEETWKHTKGKNIEIAVRDIYDIGGENMRGAKWAEMTKKILGL